MSNDEDQDDEICALQSIYNEEEFNSTTEDDGLRSGKFFAYINLPTGFRVTYKTYHNDSSSRVVVPTEHLPPITLSFRLPRSYPSDDIPEFQLSCPWLTVTKLGKLCGQLESLWDEWKGSAILYTWTNFLKEESFEWLGLKDQLDISRRHLMDLKRSGIIVKTRRNNNLNTARPRKLPRELPPLDPRVVVTPLGIPLHEYLESFNEDRSKTMFCRKFYLCAICFQEMAGHNCLQFAPCGHVYCKLCIEQYFTTRIKDAMVSSMPCPYEKCTSEANPQQVKDVVGAVLFNKYDNLLLSVTLDKMDDITYCPRVSCGSPVMRESAEEKMAACPACNYVFCVFCKRTYHGVEFCRLKSVEMKKIVKEYQEGDAAAKARVVKRYGLAQVQRFINDMLSEGWIETNSKNCPKCEASIEKSEGCNKMTCGKCGAYFCWICLATLDHNRPYDHFIDVNSGCRYKLFSNVNHEEGGDVEDMEDDFIDYEILDENFLLEMDGFEIVFENL